MRHLTRLLENLILNYQIQTNVCTFILRGRLDYFFCSMWTTLFIAGSDELTIQEVTRTLEAKFNIKDLRELHSFLEINITKTKAKMFLSQKRYLRRRLNRFNMKNCNPVATPKELNSDFSFENNTDDKTRPYRELIGCLMYVTTTTRSDLCTSVSSYSRYQSSQNETLWREP